MDFRVLPAILDCESLPEFLEKWKVSRQDLIITNEHIFAPRVKDLQLSCRVIYQERYGSGEPSDDMVDAMLAATEGTDIRRIIAIGGGTVIDIAKLFVFGDGFSCAELYEKAAELPKKRELIIIPATCGTGSEVTGISIIEFKHKETKLGLSLPTLFAEEAVLIPSLLDTMPYEVFATSSIDALIHAVESYISPKATPFSQAFSRAAIERILNGYQKMKGKRELPRDLKEFLISSSMAGIAFGNAGCAAVHAMSYPLGSNYHVAHGKANYMLFEEVLRAYRRLKADLSPLEKMLYGIFKCPEDQVWEVMFRLIGEIYDNQALGILGVDEGKCADMAALVVRTQQRLLANNPVELSEKAICDIYIRCL